MQIVFFCKISKFQVSHKFIYTIRVKLNYFVRKCIIRNEKGI